MRLVQYRLDGGPVRIGALQGAGTIVDLRRCYSSFLASRRDNDSAVDEIIPLLMESFLARGERSLAAARDAMAFAQSRADDKAPTGYAHKLDEVRLVAPLTRPGKIIGVGLNYKDHAEEAGAQLPEEPGFFSKYSNTVTGPHDDVLLPSISSEVDWEGELVVVIGRGGRHIPTGEAMSYVAGYTVCNDVSARDWQMRKPWRQWMIGKTFDTFLPLGPALVTVDEVADPYSLAIECSVNGEVMQRGNTSSMHFRIPYLINYVSRIASLEAGDIILTGTPAGVGMGQKPPRFLRDGDTLVTSIQGLGTLTNRLRMDSPS